MSPEEFKTALEASRRFEAEAAGAKFTLLLPSEYQGKVAAEEGSPSVTMRRVVEGALTGWSGVHASHILPEGPADDLPFSAENAALLLEHRQDICGALAAEISRRFVDRRKKLEGARKNSARASTGS